MIKQKEVYTSPLTEVLVVRFEGTILDSSPQWGNANDPGTIGGEDGDHFFGF